MTTRARWLLVALMLTAFALRVYQLAAQSLWSDEGLSLYRSGLTLTENLSNVIVVPPGVPTRDTNPPLYFVALSVVRAIAGDSEYALRFLSVMMGVLAVPLTYVTGRRLFSSEAGLATAAITTISPFLVWYSQEARMYTMLALLSLASVYALLRALEPGSKRPMRRWLAWVLITAAALYTHFTAFFLLPFEALAMMIGLWRVNRRWAVMAMAGVIVLAVPVIVYGVSRVPSGVEPSFSFRPLSSIAEEMVSALAIGRTNEIFQPLWAVLPMLGLAGLGLAIGWLKQRRSLLIISGYLILPLLAFYALTFIQPLFSGARHLMLMAPPFYLLAGYGLSVVWQRRWWLGAAWWMLILLFMGDWLRVQFFDPAYRKDDMRSAAQTIAARATAEDVVIVHDAISSFVFDYYYDGAAPWQIIPMYPSLDEAAALAQFQAAAQAAQRVWFVTAPPPLGGFPSNVLDDWARGHLLRLDHANYPSIWLGSEYQLYTARFPLLSALPATAQVRNLSWPAAALHLQGVEPIHVDAARQTAQTTLYWQIDQPAPFNLTFTQRLVDDTGAEWGLHIGTAFDNWSAKQWPTAKLIQHAAVLDLPRGLPQGHYRWLVKVVARQTDTLLYTSTGAEEIEVATVEIAP